MRSMNRRAFLHQAVGAMAGGATMGSTALSYGRIIGANDRISLAHVGIGNRGRGLESILSLVKDKMNVEVTAVCDIWKVNREHAASTGEKTYGRAPRTFMDLEEMLALKDIDAVIISTPEHQHSPMLKMVAEADKHAYVEKPMGNVLEEAKAARDAVLARNLIVQVGTQRRSEPYQVAAREWYKQGVTGDVSKIEIVWDYHGPRWRGRPEVKQIREEDTDWEKWLMTKPYRPFDPQLYFEYRLYKEFSSGIVDQWMSHAIDMVHWFMDDHFPVSVDVERRGFRLARRPPESGHLPDPAHLSQGLPGQLRDELWERLPQLLSPHGEKGDAHQLRNGRHAALEVGGGKR